jgi:hypothetical protein
MNTKIIRSIESGQQLGIRDKATIEGKALWISVAVQKYENSYKTYIAEIYEDDAAAEKYQREEIRRFFNIDDALQYLKDYARIDSSFLAPCKGQKIFNPAFDSCD